MAKPATKPARRPLRARLRRLLRRLVMIAIAVPLALILIYAVIRPPITPYMVTQYARYGSLTRDWVPLEDIAPVMRRSVVAAEDVHFCNHWGLDLTAIRASLAQGGAVGASTISQQTVKNVFLWHGRSWARKAIEALMTPVVEIVWSKRRILEVYLNVAEFDTGVFGIEAAARSYFGVSAKDLTPLQAARLAMVLPDPKGRSAADPRPSERKRTAHIMDGAKTIADDSRSACFRD